MFKLNLVKINRFFAWVLLVMMIIFLISGYGLAKGIIPQHVAQFLHLGHIVLILIIAFCIHTSLSVRMSLMRWRVWNSLTKAILIVIAVGIGGFFIYMDTLYPGYAGAQVQLQQNQTATTSSQSTTQTSKIFSLQELSTFNGLGGQPAYVAIDGIVYDFSPVFQNGQHHGFSAGKDLSAAFHGQHPTSFLSRFSVVGKLQ